MQEIFEVAAAIASAVLVGLTFMAVGLFIFATSVGAIAW